MHESFSTKKIKKAYTHTKDLSIIMLSLDFFERYEEISSEFRRILTVLILHFKLSAESLLVEEILIDV